MKVIQVLLLLARQAGWDNIVFIELNIFLPKQFKMLQMVAWYSNRSKMAILTVTVSELVSSFNGRGLEDLC